MKLRTYLLIANGTSIVFILICLIISYINMVLSLPATVWISSVTIVAGAISFFLHFFLTKPLETSIHRITEEAKRIASGDFQVDVPAVGPTEFRQLADQFNEMSKKLEESFEKIRSAEASRRELVANVSHDLRTPLASIQSFVEALQDDIIQDRETFHRYLATIQLETRRLGSLIDDLFRLSRLESGSEVFHPVACHIDTLLLEELQAQAIQMEKKRLTVSADVPEQLPPAAIMPEKIRQVIANLLENAIRYSPMEGMIRIRVSESEEGWIKVSVSDEGDGIEKEEQARIFERFYRTDKSRTREKGGAGLGLAIVKATIELHGGEVGVESNPGRGSCFWFTIPAFRKNPDL